MDKITAVTIDALWSDGWIKTNDPVTPMQKKIENINPLNDSEDSDIKLVIHKMYNTESFAIVFPDGGLLNFHVGSMEELKAFEKAIVFYDPPF